MAGFVKVMLIGNLGKDPDVRFTQGGTAVANLRVACTEREKGKDGQWADHTEWVSVVVWGKTAEAVGQHLKKGSQVHVDGKLRTREWNDKDGNKRTNTEVVAFNVLFLGGGKGSGDGGAKSGGGPAAGGGDGPPPLSDDDIPF